MPSLLEQRMPGAERLLAQVVDVCPFPATAQRLMTLTQDERATMDKVAAVVACDPALTAQVLRISNSAVYRRAAAAPVADLRQALLVIGLEPLRTMAGAMALLATFATRDELALDLHAICVAAGSLVSALAAPPDAASRTMPFVCGLLGEVGALACLVVDGPAYVELWDSTVASEALDPVAAAAARERVERRRYGQSTRTLGANLLRHHAIPEAIASAVEGAPAATPAVAALHHAVHFARIATPRLVYARGKDPAVVSAWLEAVAEHTMLGRPLEELTRLCLTTADQAARAVATTRA